jgi:hypothetical protein
LTYDLREQVRLAVVYGSIREGRFCDVVGRWTVERHGGFDIDLIDPARPDGGGPAPASKRWPAWRTGCTRRKRS